MGTSQPNGPPKPARCGATPRSAYLFLWKKPETGEIWAKEFSESLTPRRPTGLPEGYWPELAGRFVAASPEAMITTYPTVWENTPGLSYLNRIPWVHEAQEAAAQNQRSPLCAACVHGDPRRRRFSDGPAVCTECGRDDRELLARIIEDVLRVPSAPDIVTVDLGCLQPEQLAALQRLGAELSTNVYAYPDRAPCACVRAKLQVGRMELLACSFRDATSDEAAQVQAHGKPLPQRLVTVATVPNGGAA